jgi:hypothetical protein
MPAQLRRPPVDLELPLLPVLVPIPLLQLGEEAVAAAASPARPVQRVEAAAVPNPTLVPPSKVVAAEAEVVAPSPAWNPLQMAAEGAGVVVADCCRSLGTLRSARGIACKGTRRRGCGQTSPSRMSRACFSTARELSV